ncbi:MAG: immunoglobulin domain-containing protein, partial [Planctomycetes bacterium]|nr:immunoglobulin domain-containing protein [Planctomycetota bacterium]
AVPDSCEPNNDCNFNSIQDICDIAAGTSIDCDGNEIIDLCELDGFVDNSLFAADFVNQFPPSGWSATGLWHGTNQCPRLNECDPPRWAYFGRSGLCNFDSGLVETGTMSAPQVTIPADAVSATLTYCSAYNGEGGNANVSGFDWAYVTINGTEVDDAGVDGIQNEWEVRSVDLSAFAGQTVDIEWRFDSRDSSGNTGLGWQVDQAELIASIPVDRDCNENGTLDACEIAAGSGTDCDLDGLLDQCGPDCDSNGIPDVCDAIALLPNQPQTQEQCVGETAVFTVTAPSPSATLQWFKLATPLVDGGTISGATSNELTITNVQLADGGSYRCVITDGCVVANSDLASLSIATIPVSILLQPELQISRCAGEEAEFTVFVDGSFPHTFEWRRDGLPFGAPDSPTLTLSNLTTDDTGDYTCFASNACGGELSIIGQLSVGGGLFFQHPSDQCAEQGETITMTAGATGSGFLWAWSKDDVGIFNGGQFSGATSDTLMITNVTAANAGVYKAFAFNNSPLCLNVSEPATLSIGGCAGCPIPGDLDADGDVDLADAQNFTDCFGSDVQSSPECVCANIDDTNSAIDLADWASFAPLLTGP